MATLVCDYKDMFIDCYDRLCWFNDYAGLMGVHSPEIIIISLGLSR